MKLLILSASQALIYEPKKSTYAIRIHNSNSHGILMGPLILSSNYNKIGEYVFDDIEPGIGKGRLFDEGLAKKILTEFKEEGLASEVLLVHCTRGQNRSPAVTIALNDIFKLGNDTNKLRQEYQDMNRFVYDTLINVACEFHRL